MYGEGEGGRVRGGKGGSDLEGNGVVLHPLAAQEFVKAQAKEALGTALSIRGRPNLHVGTDNAAPARHRRPGQRPRANQGPGPGRRRSSLQRSSGPGSPLELRG